MESNEIPFKKKKVTKVPLKRQVVAFVKLVHQKR